MYQILFDGRVVRVGYETKEEAEIEKRKVISEFERKVTMRKIDPNANAQEKESAKREFEADKKAADAFNKEFPSRLEIYPYDELHAPEPEDYEPGEDQSSSPGS